MQDDHGVGEISLEAADFDVSLFSDNDGLESLGDELGELGVGDFDEGASGIDDAVSLLTPAIAVVVGGTVGGDDDLAGGGF